jgi:hypothetical protein
MEKELILVSSLLCFTAVSTLGAEEETRFVAGEWDLSPFATYVDKTGDKWGLGASATYFVTDKIGIGASTNETRDGVFLRLGVRFSL